MADIARLVDWIESHDNTIDLAKWALLLLIAWLTGSLGYLRRTTRRPRVNLVELVSWCFLQEMDEFEGHKNVVRATFLVDVEVVNRSSEPIVVQSFALRTRINTFGRRWSSWTAPVTLPSRVHHQLGDVTKIMPNWITSFADDIGQPAVETRLESRAAHVGYMLFVVFTHGSWNPIVLKDYAMVGLQVVLTTGERLRTKSRVKVTRDKEFMESFVPGLVDHVDRPGTWNVPMR